MTTYFEPVVTLTSSSGEVTVDLSKGNTFNLSLTEDISFFQITNPPTGSTSFTIKLVQDSTGGHTVGISTFKDSGGNPVSVYWGGGLLPQVTTALVRLTSIPSPLLILDLLYMVLSVDKTLQPQFKVNRYEKYIF